ncbi:MAG: GNAT family N-acetyltransferase [Ornithinimicrobium sp.]
MRPVTELLPLLALRVSAGPLELRGVSDQDLPALCELASRGIHPEHEMPFSVPWSIGPPQEIAARVAAYHWRCRGSWSPEHWSLQLGVWHEGVLVGCQGMQSADYLITRTAESGSWLGQSYQGRGIGTAMRQIICAFAFDHLDAVEVTSAALRYNRASQTVSTKIGYRENGEQRMRLGDDPVVELRYRLRPEDFVRYEHPLVIEGLEPLRRSIGLNRPG